MPLRPRKFYGRRQGHKLHPRPAAIVADHLPRLAFDLDDADPVALFETKPEVTSYALEIGFGGGEHLAARAKASPDIGFIGSEVFLNGVAKLVAQVADHGLENIRIYDEDARDLIERLPDNSFSAIFLLYPDPWHKKRHNKRRFVSPQHLEQFHRILKADGYFYFASDIADYTSWTLATVRDHGKFEWLAKTADDWRLPFHDWPGTRYEAKAIAAGRKPSYLTFKPIG